MAEKEKRRGFINVVLVLSLIAFVGFSIAPLWNMMTANRTPSEGATATSTPAINIQQTELEKQVQGYQLVLQREPDNQTALRGVLEAQLQLLQMGQGDLQAIISPLEKLSQLNPDQTDYAILLAQVKEQAADAEGAAQTYRSILSAQPGNIAALEGLVNLLLGQQRPEAAIGLLQDTLKAAPQANQVEAGSIDVVSVQLILGKVYASQQRYEEAIAVYDEATKVDGQDFRPPLGKAIVLQQQGQSETAQSFFDKSLELAPASYRDQIQQLAQGQPQTPATPESQPSATETPPSESE